MTLRFRKSMKLMPGVRINFNKNSVGMSFGVPGARYTINSKGRRTVSTGIPGTGLYNIETLSRGERSPSASASRSNLDAEQAFAPNDLPKSMQPGFFAAKAERELSKYIKEIFQGDATVTPDQAVEKAIALQASYPTLKYSLELLKFLNSVKGSKVEDEVGYQWGKELWSKRDTVFSDRYVIKYFSGITSQVPITNGISTSSTYNDQTLGHILVEFLQQLHKTEEAMAVLHEMVPDHLVAISMADLEIGAKDYDGAIETTEDIENVDDATAMLLILRGVAFREKGLEDASLECLKRALSKKDRSEGLLHRALFERAETYARMGKKAMAIKDLEKILVDDSDYPAVQEKLEKLNAE